MCLIIFSWQPDAETPLLIIANRDEFYDRPTLKAHFWEESPSIFAGQDLQAGGSWLGINTSGNFAAVTNVREWPSRPGSLSRGELVSSYLKGRRIPQDYLSDVQQRRQLYAGFNLLIGDIHHLYYLSNRGKDVQVLQPGIYGLSNHLLNSPWPKVLKTRDAVSALLNSNNDAPPEALINVMQDREKAPDHALPDTGVSLERERLLSSPFIASEDYGTRNTSVLQFSSDGRLKWVEQTYANQGRFDELQIFSHHFL